MKSSNAHGDIGITPLYNCSIGFFGLVSFFIQPFSMGFFWGVFNKFLKKCEYGEKDDDYKSENQREKNAEK